MSSSSTTTNSTTTTDAAFSFEFNTFISSYPNPITKESEKNDDNEDDLDFGEDVWALLVELSLEKGEREGMLFSASLLPLSRWLQLYQLIKRHATPVCLESPLAKEARALVTEPMQNAARKKIGADLFAFTRALESGQKLLLSCADEDLVSAAVAVSDRLVRERQIVRLAQSATALSSSSSSTQSLFDTCALKMLCLPGALVCQLPHSCLPNAAIEFDASSNPAEAGKRLRLRLSATRNREAGEENSRCWGQGLMLMDDPLSSTILQRLLGSKCNCSRCQFEAYYINRCKSGRIDLKTTVNDLSLSWVPRQLAYALMRGEGRGEEAERLLKFSLLMVQSALARSPSVVGVDAVFGLCDGYHALGAVYLGCGRWNKVKGASFPFSLIFLLNGIIFV